MVKRHAGAGIAEQIPRNSLALLMVAQLVVVIPLASYVSIWIVGVCLFSGYWRTQVYRGRWGYPPTWVKAILVVASFAGLAISGYRAFTLEAATSLLVLAFALKLIEMRNRRDAFLVIFLCYFLTANAFLFDQSIAMAIYQVFAVIVATAALVGLNQLQSRVRPLASFWTAGGLVLQALPLTLVLFLLFPRIGPLWSVPLPNAATTGLSDKITPGDVASLSQSDDLAFRVLFEGEVPRNRDLYWRGLVYSHYEQGTWSVGPALPVVAKPNSDASEFAYQIFLEPTQSRWLYALDTPTDFSPKIEMLRDFRLLSHDPVRSVLRYRVETDREVVLDPELPGWLRRRELALPEGDNPRMRSYAASLQATYNHPSDMVMAMMRELQNDFVYTLQPPTLPTRDGIDALWFDTQAGFCSHFAGAMVFTLRAAGIPARMVGGYQGGEINPVTGHVVVRQYLAHAWVEYWVAERGWVRVDPTSAVAPERVESGLRAALSNNERSALSIFTTARMGQGAILTDILQWADSLEHQWNLWVVGYDADTQSSVLKDLLGKITPLKIGIAIAVGGGVSLLFVSVALFWRRRPVGRHPAARDYSSFCLRMDRLGLGREPGETPAIYLARLAAIAKLDGAQDENLVQRALYDPEAPRSTMRALQQWLRRLQINLLFALRRT
ncbi:MAG: DUF3488 domain-containing protein [Pseudomonadales bacterium]|nr:DUF3488 domain-containing protein [Pseudomonadales bacterium]